MPTAEPQPPSSAAPEPQPYLPSGWRRMKAEMAAEEQSTKRGHASYAYLLVYGVMFALGLIVALAVGGLLMQMVLAVLRGGAPY